MDKGQIIWLMLTAGGKRTSEEQVVEIKSVKALVRNQRKSILTQLQ
jgi:hypothetical protein